MNEKDPQQLPWTQEQLEAVHHPAPNRIGLFRSIGRTVTRVLGRKGEIDAVSLAVGAYAEHLVLYDQEERGLWMSPRFRDGVKSRVLKTQERLSDDQRVEVERLADELRRHTKETRPSKEIEE